MKVRVRPGEVEIATIQGQPIVRAVGKNTLQAIRRMRGLVETLEADSEWPGHAKAVSR